MSKTLRSASIPSFLHRIKNQVSLSTKTYLFCVLDSERNSQERFIEKDIIGDGLVFQEQDSFNLSPPAILAPREILT